jgi:hypothetical protein
MIVAENYYNRGMSSDASVSVIPFDARTLLNPIKLMRTL